MRALLCTRLDGPEHLEIVERPDPVPGPGQALVRMRLAALNFFDTLITAGRYQVKPALPFSPGGEGSAWSRRWVRGPRACPWATG